MKPESDYAMLAFPVVWIGLKDVRAFIDLEHMRTCDEGLLKAGYRKRGCIVDGNLVHREVKEVRIAGYVPPFGGYRLPGTRMLRLDFEFVGGAKPVSLADLKTLIVQADRSSGMYEGMAGSPRSHEASINRMESFDSVVKAYLIGPKRGWLRKFWAGPFD